MANRVQQKIPDQREVVVYIHPDTETGKITIASGQDPFVMHKHQDQQVRWVCDPDLPFMVEFEPNDCPFYESQFSHDHPCSGLARRELVPNGKKTYKYTVRVPGCEDLDPEGSIDK